MHSIDHDPISVRPTSVRRPQACLQPGIAKCWALTRRMAYVRETIFFVGCFVRCELVKSEAFVSCKFPF